MKPQDLVKLVILWLFSSVFSYLILMITNRASLLAAFQSGGLIIAVLLFHEFGHWLSYRIFGIRATFGTSLKNGGAYIRATDSIERLSQHQHNVVVFAGQLFNALGTLVLIILDSNIKSLGISTAIYLNLLIGLLNVMPQGYNDGTRILARISKTNFPNSFIGIQLLAVLIALVASLIQLLLYQNIALIPITLCLTAILIMNLRQARLKEIGLLFEIEQGILTKSQKPLWTTLYLLLVVFYCLGFNFSQFFIV